RRPLVDASILADHAGDRAEVDDRAGARLHHVLAYNVLRAEEDAGEVDIDRVLPVLDAPLLQGGALRGTDDVARVVDQDVDAPELGQAGIDRRLDIGLISDIELDGEHPSAGRGTDLLRRLFRIADLAGGDADIGPRLREC